MRRSVENVDPRGLPLLSGDCPLLLPQRLRQAKTMTQTDPYTGMTIGLLRRTLQPSVGRRLTSTVEHTKNIESVKKATDECAESTRAERQHCLA